MKGLPIVISAPSGGGKSTIAYHIAREMPSVTRSISVTTRPPRPGEKDGVDYYFASPEAFKRKIKTKEFLEWAEVHGNYYGTPRVGVETHMREGRDVILTIDPQGARAIKCVYPKGVFIFLVPPTWEELIKRLNLRGEDEKTRALRLANARKELATVSSYDYLVINDRLAEALSDVKAILQAEHRRLTRINKKDISIFARVDGRAVKI